MSIQPLDAARRIAFMLARAERRLGFPDDCRLSLNARIGNVLEGAMERPALVDADTYRVMYALLPRGVATEQEGI